MGFPGSDSAQSPSTIDSGGSNMFKLILVALSFVFGLRSIRRLRQYDVHEEEPFRKMAAVTIWGGMMSVGISLFLYGVLKSQGVSIRAGFPISILWVGFIEELGKLLALFLCWPIIRREMNEPTDGPIYMACVALGFSLIENYFYASATPLASPLIVIRLLICTPMHIAFSLFMGLAFYWARRFKGGWGILLAAYTVASLYHAFYDIFVGIWFLLPGLYLILKSAYGWMYRLLGYTAAVSPFRQTLEQFLLGAQPAEIEPGHECLDCGNHAPKPMIRQGRIRVFKCEDCGAYICSEKTLRHLVHHFGSIFGNLKQKVKPLSRTNRSMRVLIAGNRIDRRKRIACFDLAAFNDALEKTTRDVVIRTECKWWFPFRSER